MTNPEKKLVKQLTTEVTKQSLKKINDNFLEKFDFVLKNHLPVTIIIEFVVTSIS